MKKLFLQYPYLLCFTILSASFSGPGQTYFISLYIPSIREELDLTNSQIAGLYSFATILSAALNPVLGKLFDRLSVKAFSLMMTLGLALGALVLGLSHHIVLVVLSFWMLRYFGQSGFGMTSVVTATKNFGNSRGKALGITSLGFPLAEMSFPLFIGLLVHTWGWRLTSFATMALILFFYLPFSQFFLYKAKMTGPEPAEDVKKTEESKSEPSWTAKQALSSWRFYFLLAIVFIPPFLNTGIIFHQGKIGQIKTWPETTLPTALFSFGLFRGIFSLIIGPVIDRVSAKKLYGFHFIPTVAGLLILGYGNEPFTAILALGLLGVTVGMGGPIRSALFAEFFGTKNLGTINAFSSAFMVFSTAAAPFLFGLSFDYHVPLSHLLVFSVLLTVFCFILGRIGISAHRWRGTPA